MVTIQLTDVSTWERLAWGLGQKRESAQQLGATRTAPAAHTMLLARDSTKHS